MTRPDPPRDEGGEAPCFAHLIDQHQGIEDDILARLTRELADALVIADPEGTITFWNEAATKLFGWSAEDAIGQTLDLIIPERLRARHWAGYRRAMATGHTDYGGRLLEVPALHRDRHGLSIAFTVTLLCRPGENQPFAIAAVIRDDTERWEELRELKQQLASYELGRAAP